MSMSVDPQPVPVVGRSERAAVSPTAKVRALARPIAQLRELLIAKTTEHQVAAGQRRLVEDAFDFAVAAHEGQLRASGEPYVTHPAEAALILADLGLDASTLAAALLRGRLGQELLGVGDRDGQRLQLPARPPTVAAEERLAVVADLGLARHAAAGDILP